MQLDTLMNLDTLLAFVPPEPPDLWAFYVLAGLWVLILSFVLVMVRWLRDHSVDEGHRGL